MFGQPNWVHEIWSCRELDAIVQWMQLFELRFRLTFNHDLRKINQLFFVFYVIAAVAVADESVAVAVAAVGGSCAGAAAGGCSTKIVVTNVWEIQLSLQLCNLRWILLHLI